MMARWKKRKLGQDKGDKVFLGNHECVNVCHVREIRIGEIHMRKERKKK
jgi:hypothetical protein